ncbi:MAG: glycosyltransferase [Chloroflexi bacterium]|nr:glycosyltransferase [Chloroflexota bacterium]
MHVAFLTDVALPYVSGVTVAVKRQRDALRANGDEVTVVGPHGDVDIAQPDLHVPGAPAGYRIAMFAPGLGARLASRGVTSLHAHSVFGASGAALTIARARGLPFLLTLHTRLDEYVHYAKVAAPLAKMLLDPYLDAVLGSADLVVAPCAELADEIHDRARAVEVVAAPIEPLLAAGDARRGRDAAGVADGVPLLLSISRLALEKRVGDLLELLASLRRRDAVLAYAGAGPLREELGARVGALGLTDRVRFLGQLDSAALADALAAADLVVSASRSETQGLALCEAAAAGRAVVAPRRGGYSEILDGGAGLFPSATPAPQELAACVDELLDDDARRTALAKEASTRALAAWSPDAVAVALRGAHERARRMRE